VPITAERLQYVNKESVDIEKDKVREPLMEHVGHLPVIASFLYPRIDSTDDINLGRVLSMLSIHDIGETEVGDVFTFDKTQRDQDREQAAVRNILSEELLPYFEEFEEQNTKDGKFAKSVDALAPFLHELSHPEITRRKLEKYDFGSEDMRKEKEQYFQWDPVLAELFEVVIEGIEQIEEVS
jgi:putative hydrolase of HD superfamily